MKFSIHNIKFVLIAIFILSGNFIHSQIRDENNIDSLGMERVPSPLFELNKTVSTSAVSIISGEMLSKTPSANITNAMYGLTPGLIVNQGNGTIGYDAAWLLIRGIGSYNYGNYIIYVDGFQTEMRYFQYMMAAEIESISILKDAAALSYFGVKGGNGVIWVKTKRGNIGKPKIALQVNTGVKEALSLSKPLEAYEYASLYNEAYSNDRNRTWNSYYTESAIERYKNGDLPNTDWYDTVLKDNAMLSSINISVKGGDKNVRYYTLIGYVNDNGLYNVKNDDKNSNLRFQMYNIRTNLDFNLFEIFEGKIDLGGRLENRFSPNYGTNNLWNNLARYPNNIYYPKNEDGSWAGTSIYPDNPLASITGVGLTKTNDRLLQANLSLKERLDFITPGLYAIQAVSFSTWTRGTYNVSRNYGRYLDGLIQTPDVNTNYSVFDDRGTNQWQSRQLRVGLGYNKNFDNGVITSAIDYLQSLYEQDQSMNGDLGVNSKYAHQNIGGRVHYEHNKRYAAEFSFAYSGSDNFKKGNRFGFYPAVSAAWVISNEPFFKFNAINELKLRSSYGITGWDMFDQGRYLYQSYYTGFRNFLTGNTPPSARWGLEQLYTTNDNITAEKGYKFNLGLETLFLNKFSLIFDAFLDKRKGIPTYDNTMPSVFGARSLYSNLGEVTTKGLEVGIDFKDNIDDFKYMIGFNATNLIDKINFMGEVTQAGPSSAQTGRSIGTAFGYEFDRFYDIQDFDDNGNLVSGIPVPNLGQIQPGDLMYKDINGDNIIDDRDRIEIGNPYLPRLSYAVKMAAEYKGVDFSMLLQGIYGRTVNLLDSWNKVVAFEDNGNAYAIAKDRWAYYPEQGIDTRVNATYPRLSLQGNGNNYIRSTFWQKSADFLRIRNIELGYTFPISLLETINVSTFRIFVNAVNPFTFSKFQNEYNMDPETRSGHPAFKSYNIGLSLNF